ncbi:MAG: hypothetical protein ACR2I9_05825 [Candidatus Nanopelagicaceae bacterium]
MLIMLKKLVRRINAEVGTVESALVLIPLLVLFLATMQLMVTVNFRNLDMASTQNQASLQAVHQVVEPRNELIDLRSGDFFTKLRLLVVKSERNLPEIFPGINELLGGKKLRTTGVAVYEESEECSGGYLVC